MLRQSLKLEALALMLFVALLKLPHPGEPHPGPTASCTGAPPLIPILIKPSLDQLGHAAEAEAEGCG